MFELIPCDTHRQQQNIVAKFSAGLASSVKCELCVYKDSCTLVEADEDTKCILG